MEESAARLTGMILEIQRLSTEDGPGIRSTIFMKGCSMHCLWCHNPESIPARPQLQWFGSRCLGCRTCLNVCSNSALNLTAEGMQISRAICQSCGKCAEECPSNALEILGKKWTVPELTREVLKDKAFFEKSGGGVTFSGGEATLQYPFVSEVMKNLAGAGLHIALDTCGLTGQNALTALLPFVDLVLFDLKVFDPVRHRQLTGAPLEKILEGLEHICKTMRTAGRPAEMWIRTPIIPQATDDPENIRGIGNHIQSRCADLVTRWDLLAFNNLCKDKYDRLGIEWQFASAKLITQAQKELLMQTACESIAHPEIVHWNGNVSLEDDAQLPFDEIPLTVENGCN